MKKLTLLRRVLSDSETVGELLIGDTRFCYTLEPPVRGSAAHPKGAIPEGWYRVSVTMSPRFGRQLPLLHLVPAFDGIRIHAGNSVRDTAGCILVGEMDEDALAAMPKGGFRLLESRKTENRLTELLKSFLPYEEVYINITTVERRNSELYAYTKGYDYFARRAN